MAEFFPTDVLVEILLRLPSCARRRSRLVCQLWRDTVDTRTTTEIRPRTVVATKESVHLIEDLPSSSSDSSPTGSRDLWAGDAFKGMHLVGTCNGLVCMCDNRFRHRQKPGGSITLANQVTGEALAIPPLRHAKYSWCSYLMYGFGYHPATGRYKVVHVPYLSDRVSVFTLGEAAWRTVATSSPKETYDVNTGIVSVNGAAYWAVKEPAAKVVSFDLGNEHITYIRPLPDELSRPGCWRLTEVRGKLGIAFSQDDKTEVWVMEQCTWSRWGYDQDLLLFADSMEEVSILRGSNCRAKGAAPGFKFAVLGASGGIGQPLSLLMKMNPLVSVLHLYDVANTPGVTADISHMNTVHCAAAFVFLIPSVGVHRFLGSAPARLLASRCRHRMTSSSTPTTSSRTSDFFGNLNMGDNDAAAKQINSSSVAAATRPPLFDGMHYKRWRTKAVLWFTNLGCFSATDARPEGPLSAEEQEKFEKVDAMFKAALFSILGDNIVDPYMAFDHGKDAWDALEAKFGVSDAGTELYVMEQYYDYKMTDERSVVEQAHEIRSLAKELEQFKCTLPDKFVAGGIIAKLSPSWRNFATSLKHKRQEFSVSDLIGSLHVEEKARAKDTRIRSFEGGSSANVVQKKNFQSNKSKNNNNGKGKFDEKNKASNSTNFKRKTPYKKKGNCHVCGAPGHWAPDCPERHDRRGNSGKSANVVIGVDTEMKDVGTVDFLRADGKRLTCFVRGVGTVDLKFTSGKTIQLKNVQHEMPSSSTQELFPEPTMAIEHFDNPVEDDNEAPKRSKRQRTAKSFGHDFIVYLVEDTPTSISEAYASLDADYWKEAVRSEMDSILANGTWEITDRPYGCKPVGCKWVFKKNLRPDGTIEKYKARLVAKGYTQKEGEDFFDTYSPVARLTTIRVLLSLAASHGLLVHQMDVKTAFLNGELEEEIYMEQPNGFVVDGQEGKWHEKFERTLTTEGFVVNEADKCVYYRHGGAR
ncbi:hypothetical protein QYE76_007515, partial [Lolium multiflorum]